MCQVRAYGPLVQNCLCIYINMQYTKRWMNIKKCFAEKTVPSYPLYLWKRNQFLFCWISTGCAMSCSRGCVMSCSQCRVIQDAAFFLPQLSSWKDTSPAGFQPAQTENLFTLSHPSPCQLQAHLLPGEHSLQQAGYHQASLYLKGGHLCSSLCLMQ